MTTPMSNGERMIWAQFYVEGLRAAPAVLMIADGVTPAPWSRQQYAAEHASREIFALREQANIIKGSLDVGYAMLLQDMLEGDMTHAPHPTKKGARPMRIEKQAFPIPTVLDENGDPFSLGQHGLTRRELFAAMVMQGMLSNDDWDWNPEYSNVSPAHAVRFADALIAELDK